ncbi:hypothetical protein [Streptomyces sp. BPTC-684]|uniref:hypothetical protein n=1 Tax=Streptomyces sp. BPTC-684 TaxID=3043734 RepID=UPI0024B185EF|nr:hypothetical protein [Streptomyces sp. BPTC-684]WHM41557.1 hypothetical protein QIY60_31590 [Streptomyces sp. BPTC-684]
MTANLVVSASLPANLVARATRPCCEVVPEDARHPLIEPDPEGNCRVNAGRRQHSGVVEAVVEVHVSPAAPEQHHRQLRVRRSGDDHTDRVGITYECPVRLKLLGPWRGFVTPRQLPNPETDCSPPRGSLRNHCGRLIKINDSLHKEIIAHPDVLFSLVSQCAGTR